MQPVTFNYLASWCRLCTTNLSLLIRTDMWYVLPVNPGHPLVDQHHLHLQHYHQFQSHPHPHPHHHHHTHIHHHRRVVNYAAVSTYSTDRNTRVHCQQLLSPKSEIEYLSTHFSQFLSSRLPFQVPSPSCLPHYLPLSSSLFPCLLPYAFPRSHPSVDCPVKMGVRSKLIFIFHWVQAASNRYRDKSPSFSLLT